MIKVFFFSLCYCAATSFVAAQSYPLWNKAGFEWGSTAIATAPSNSLVVVAGSWRNLFLFDYSQGKPLRSMNADTVYATYWSAGFSPDGQYIYAGESGIIRKWGIGGDLLMEKQIHSINARVSNLIVSPDGNSVVSSSEDSILSCIDTKLFSTQWRKIAEPNEGWGRIAFSHDGNKIALIKYGASTKLDSVLILDAHSGFQMQTISIEAPRYLVFRQDNENIVLLADSNGNSKVKLLNIATNAIKNLIDSISRPTNSFAFSSDGQYMTTTDGNYIYHLATEKDSVLSKVIYPDAEFAALVYSADNTRIIIASSNSSVITWDLSTDILEPTMTSHRSKIADLSFSDDGELLASVEKLSGPIKIWDVKSGALKYECSPGLSNGHISFLGNKQFVFGDPSGKVYTVTLPDRKTHLLMQYEDPVEALAVSPDNMFIAVAFQKRNPSGKTFRVLLAALSTDTNYITDLGTWDSPTTGECELDYSSDGKYLLMTTAKGCLALTLESRSVQYEQLILGDVTDILSIPNSSIMYAMSDGGGIHKVDYVNKYEISYVQGNGMKMELTQDKSRLLLLPNSRDHFGMYLSAPLRLVDTANAKLLYTYDSLQFAQITFAVAKNVNLVATGDEKGGIAVWRIPTKVMVTESASAHTSVITVTPNPAKDIVTLCFDGSITRPITFVIRDILGNIITSKMLSRDKNWTLDVSNIPAGIYYCSATGNGSASIKLIVTH